MILQPLKQSSRILAKGMELMLKMNRKRKRSHLKLILTITWLLTFNFITASPLRLHFPPHHRNKQHSLIWDILMHNGNWLLTVWDCLWAVCPSPPLPMLNREDARYGKRLLLHIHGIHSQFCWSKSWLHLALSLLHRALTPFLLFNARAQWKKA